MKKLLKVVAVAAALGIPAVHAGTTGPQGFNVTVNLTSACTISTVTDVAFTYTSFQPGPATATGGAFTVSCTNTLPYTVALNSAAGSVIGLNYTLALSAASGTGNGAAQALSINGTMAGGQGGTCAAATCSGSNNTHTVTINY